VTMGNASEQAEGNSRDCGLMARGAGGWETGYSKDFTRKNTPIQSGGGAWGKGGGKEQTRSIRSRESEDSFQETLTNGCGVEPGPNISSKSYTITVTRTGGTKRYV